MIFKVQTGGIKEGTNNILRIIEGRLQMNFVLFAVFFFFKASPIPGLIELFPSAAQSVSRGIDGAAIQEISKLSANARTLGPFNGGISKVVTPTSRITKIIRPSTHDFEVAQKGLQSATLELNSALQDFTFAESELGKIEEMLPFKPSQDWKIGDSYTEAVKKFTNAEMNLKKALNTFDMAKQSSLDLNRNWNFKVRF